MSKTSDNDRFSALFETAHVAGMRAGTEVGVTPMIVGTPDGAGGVDTSKKTYFVPDGVCGFASIIIKPARGKFVTYLKRHDLGRTGSGTGCWIWCHEFNQSLTRKTAYCSAFADVLIEAGIKGVRIDSRMD